MTTRFGCAVVLVLGLAASVAQAQSLSLGMEFVVNTTPTGTQGFAESDGKVNSVASNGINKTIVVWAGNGPGDTSGIFGRLFKDGAPLGDEFRINTTTAGEQKVGIVAMNVSGQFVVAWAASNPSMPDHYAVFAQRYYATGLAQGSEIMVTSFSKPSTNGPASIAMDDFGNFVIAYSGASKYSWGWFADGGLYYFQRYNALGQAQGKAVLLENASMHGGIMAVAMHATNGNFVVTWKGDAGVVARRYSSSGQAQGSVQSISTSGTGPSVAMDDVGDYAISWAEGATLCAQVFLANGTPDISFQYAENTSRASVSMDENQILFAYIQGYPYVEGQPYEPSDAFVVRFDRLNNTLEDLQVSDPAATADQHAPSVALTGFNEALVVWSGPNPNGTDGEDVFGCWLAVTTP